MSTDLRPPASVAPGDSSVPGPTPRAASSALGTHHPGLDGLRGVAVGGVLLFHAGVSWAVGGFLGVSLFFTLSGFLIMGVLLRNHLAPGGGLRSFWVRRARRLLPAAFLALAGVVLFGATVATRQQADALPGQVAAAATWTANWHFLITGRSYVDLFSAPSPVQHFWSLAIEEQFYLILPIVLLLLVRRTRSTRILAGVLGGAALLSSVWMVVLYHRGASLDRLYYGTDTRIAELLIGAAVAVVISRVGTDWSKPVRRVTGFAGLVALAAILWSWANVPLADGMLWRGGFLLYAALSCTAIVGVLANSGPLVKVLSWRPLTFTGRISYGLYLYHFPIYLWLTEARTGLGLWALLALRLTVTFTVAILSYRYVEQPILHGASLGVRGSLRLAAIPIAIVVVIAATVVTVNRSGEDPLATLRADAASLAMPRQASDGVLDLLVIPPSADDPVVAQLERDVRGNSSVKLTVAEPFACTGGLVKVEGGRTCASWARSFPDLVKRHDPDAVVLYVDDWAGEDLSGGNRQQKIATAGDLVAPAIDLLAARGAPIIWASAPSKDPNPFAQWFLPLNQALLRLEGQRSDIFRTIGMPDAATLAPDAFATQAAKKLLDDASLHQRSSDDGLPKVMIVGDSQSLSLGYGLDRWAAQNGRALVWNRGIEGCGLAVRGEVRTFGSQDSDLDRCRDVVRAWPRQVRAFRPDIVIVLSSLDDVQDRRLPGSSEFRSVGDPELDAFLVQQYTDVVDTLSATGARVIWMTSPCFGLESTAGQESAAAGADTDHLNSAIISKVKRSRPDRVETFDLAKVYCPHGKALETVGGIDDPRPDGVHYSVASSLWFAWTYGDELLKLGGQ